MTRKDYIKFAAMLANTTLQDEEANSCSWEQIVTDIADVFAADNPNFNRDKFYEACGYHE